jgi:dienelactone hydrolase
MNTAIALVKRDPGIDHFRIAVAGKSLGSIIAWQVFHSTPDLRGAILLTPVCAQPTADAASTNYPGLADEGRPRVWIMGDVDPVCPVATFQHFIAAAGKGERINVISGDHGFETPGHPERDPRTFDLLLRLTSDFAATLLAPQSERVLPR